MWLSLLQAWIYQHFRGICSKDVRAGYREDYPRAMVFEPRMVFFTPDEYRTHMDALDQSTYVMASYAKHREACPFEQVSLYSRWLRYGPCRVRYLPKRVLLQFGYVYTVPRHPCENAPPQDTLGDITLSFQRAIDYALTPQELVTVQCNNCNLSIK